jgi:chemotaxis protein MotB
LSETNPKKSKRIPMHNQQHGGDDGEGNWLVSYADMMTLLVGFFVILLSFSSVDAAKFKEAQKSVVEKFGGKIEDPFKDLYESLKKELDKLKLGDSVEIKKEDNGVSISFLGTVFFNLGSADVKGEAKDLLGKIIPIIKTQAQGFHILVEGHTDNVPISNGTTFRTNWELSSVRACRVLNSFESSGFDRNKLNAVGLADTKPAYPNANPDSSPNPVNQAKNRRVVIKILKGAEKVFGLESAL